jgi:hypothetical protein
MTVSKLHEVSLQDGYIQNRIWGDADGDDFVAATDEALAMKEKTHVNKLLCHIKELRPTKIDINAQTSGIGTLWRIQAFEKVAFLLGDPDVSKLVHSSLELTNFAERFHTFEDEDTAIKWLLSD